MKIKNFSFHPMHLVALGAFLFLLFKLFFGEGTGFLFLDILAFCLIAPGTWMVLDQMNRYNKFNK